MTLCVETTDEYPKFISSVGKHAPAVCLLTGMEQCNTSVTPHWLLAWQFDKRGNRKHVLRHQK